MTWLTNWAPNKRSRTSSSNKDPAVSRPTGFADLAGKRVGIFGYGVEGRATQRRLQGVTDAVVLVDDATDIDPDVTPTSAGGFEKLLECDVVLKSPGIPRPRPAVLALEAHGGAA